MSDRMVGYLFWGSLPSFFAGGWLLGALTGGTSWGFWLGGLAALVAGLLWASRGTPRELDTPPRRRGYRPRYYPDQGDKGGGCATTSITAAPNCSRSLAGVETHRDHFVPFSRGGDDHARNIVPACRDCNMDKGWQHPDWYRATDPNPMLAKWKALPGDRAQAWSPQWRPSEPEPVEPAMSAAERDWWSGVAEAITDDDMGSAVVAYLFSGDLYADADYGDIAAEGVRLGFLTPRQAVEYELALGAPISIGQPTTLDFQALDAMEALGLDATELRELLEGPEQIGGRAP